MNFFYPIFKYITTQDMFWVSFLSQLLSGIVLALVVGLFVNYFTTIFKRPKLSLVVKQNGLYRSTVLLTERSGGDYEAISCILAIKNSGTKTVRAGEGYWHTYIRTDVHNSFSAPEESNHQRGVFEHVIYPNSFVDLGLVYNFRIKKEDLLGKINYFFQTEYGTFPKTAQLDPESGIVLFKNMNQLHFELPGGKKSRMSYNTDMNKIQIRAAIAAGWSAFMLRPWYLLGLSLAFTLLFVVSVGDAAVTALAYVLYGGYLGMLIGHFRGYRIEFDDMFSMDTQWVSYAFLALIKSFLILLGFICFIIPGIYLAVRWSFAELLVIDQGMRPLEALRASSKMTEGNRWKLFWMSIVVGLMFIAGLLVFVIGAVVVGIMVTFAMIKIYDDLKSKLDETDEDEENGNDEEITIDASKVVA